MKLLTSQKNQLYDLIESRGLEPFQFEITEKSDSLGFVSTKVNHKNSDYYFSIHTNFSGGINVSYSPGKEHYEVSASVANWTGALTRFGMWVTHLKREVTIDDKWSRLLSDVESIQVITSEGDESLFTVVEYEKVSNNIDLIKDRITSLELLPEQINLINAKLDHLRLMARSLKKTDWKNLFIGAMVSIPIAASVSPETTLKFWAIIKEVFASYLLK